MIFKLSSVETKNITHKFVLCLFSADTEVFKVKKSSTSRRIAKQLKKEKKSRNQGPNGNSGRYSDDENDSSEESTKKRHEEDEEAKAEERIRVRASK